MTEHEAVEHARRLFLDDRNVFGCAETTFLALKGAFDLGDPADSSPAMALNGGIAYSGGMCGAISGAALAVGMLAQRRVDEHRTAKRVARLITARLIDAFEAEYGALDCRQLIGLELRGPGQHEAFIASGLWRERCMRQVEFAVRMLAPLANAAAWDRIVVELGRPGE